jgi:hypothetical protein
MASPSPGLLAGTAIRVGMLTHQCTLPCKRPSPSHTPPFAEIGPPGPGPTTP